MRRYITLALIFSLLLTSVPALANGFDNVNLSSINASEDGSNNNFDRDRAIKVGGTVLVLGGLVYLGNRFFKNREAAKLYETAEAYASRGEWGKAVEAYEEVVDVVDDYEDTRTKLAEARDKAEDMYVRLGDEAKAEEKYEEARSYYHLALRYQPSSMRAQNKVDAIEDDLVAVHYRRGHTFEVRGEWEDAYQEYQKAYNVNPNYQDLADRFHRARAYTEGEIPLRALMFILNRSVQAGLEGSFINALQSELESMPTDEFYMIDRDNVQEIINEQGEALSQTRDEKLAKEIANILGAQEIIMGQILELDTSSDEILIRLELEIIDINSDEIIREIEYEYEFDQRVGLNDLTQNMDSLARELVDDEF